MIVFIYVLWISICILNLSTCFYILVPVQKTNKTNIKEKFFIDLNNAKVFQVVQLRLASMYNTASILNKYSIGRNQQDSNLPKPQTKTKLWMDRWGYNKKPTKTKPRWLNENVGNKSMRHQLIKTSKSYEFRWKYKTLVYGTSNIQTLQQIWLSMKIEGKGNETATCQNIQPIWLCMGMWDISVWDSNLSELPTNMTRTGNVRY